MFNVLRDWMQRYFSDEEAVVLAVLLVVNVHCSLILLSLTTIPVNLLRGADLRTEAVPG